MGPIGKFSILNSKLMLEKFPCQFYIILNKKKFFLAEIKEQH